MTSASWPHRSGSLGPRRHLRREVVYGFGDGELDDLVLAYATTIHKAQGSEYPAVVIPVMTQHYAMLARNLLYTGVTRGKKLVVLVGQRRALAIAVRNGGQRRRWSKLREWLSLDRGSVPGRLGIGRVAPRRGCLVCVPNEASVSHPGWHVT